jgi:cold shock CspA family protein
MTSNKDVVTPSSSERLIGRVKWFNNKAGYGFITVTDGSHSGSDYFVHHSAVDVENQQYKYLVQGEYVEFGLVKTTSGTHEWQASDVNGIKGGKLMCETRHELKVARTVYKSENAPSQTEVVSEVETKAPRQQRPPRQQRAPRARGEGPRDGEKKEWTLVGNKSTEKSYANAAKKVPTVRKNAPRQGATIITIESK